MISNVIQNFLYKFVFSHTIDYWLGRVVPRNSSLYITQVTRVVAYFSRRENTYYLFGRDGPRLFYFYVCEGRVPKLITLAEQYIVMSRTELKCKKQLVAGGSNSWRHPYHAIWLSALRNTDCTTLMWIMSAVQL